MSIIATYTVSSFGGRFEAVLITPSGFKLLLPSNVP